MIMHAMCKEDHKILWLIDNTYPLHMMERLEYLSDFKEVTNGGHVTFGIIKMEQYEDKVSWQMGFFQYRELHMLMV